MSISAEQSHAVAVSRAAGPRPRCALHERGGCRGHLQADHILKAQTLRALWAQAGIWHRTPEPHWVIRFQAVSSDLLVADGRNGWLLCRLGHHMPKDLKLLDPPLSAEEVPAEFFRFVAEWGIEHAVEREFGWVL